MDIIISNKQYVLLYRNGVKRVKNWSGVECDEDAQRDGYYRKIKELLLHFYSVNPGHPTFTEFCHQMGIDIEHETVNRILIKDVDPWICFTDTHDMVLYFGKDKPIRKTKTYKKVSKHVKFWQNIFKWGNKERYGNEYYYWDVKDKNKLVVCGFSTLTKTFPEFIDQSNSNLVPCTVPYTVDLTKVEPFKEHEHDYEYSQEYINQLKAEEEREKRRQKEYAVETERRKHTPGYCSRCGADGADYVANPFDREINNRIHMQWLCRNCYNSIAGDT